MLISLEAVSEREFSLYPQLELGLGFALARFQTCFAFLAPCKQSTIFTTFAWPSLKVICREQEEKVKEKEEKEKRKTVKKPGAVVFIRPLF